MKKIIITLVLIAALSAYPFFNMIGLANSSVSVVDADLSKGNSVIEKLSNYDVKTAQKNVKTAESKRNDPAGRKKKVKEILSNLDKGKTTYRKVFKNVYIVGDSLMNGLEAYNILNSNHLITQVSASLYHLDENVDKIIKLNPPVLILHYGINMIATEKKYLNSYISLYTSLIKELKSALPDTRIIISGLFPVDREVAKAKRFAKVGEYNNSLKEMCKKLKVEFMDSSSVLKEHPECYGGDGIHLSKAFYEKYWLRFIIKEMEIVG